MTANIITVLAVVAGILWLGIMVVSALRNRGGEEVSPNLQPGIDDQQLETRRLERGQKFAIACSAFLAISLPLYFLGESNRQEGFVEEFSEASEERGEHLVDEFACYSCHGPLGVGGVANYVEKRSGVTVSWTAPPLNDIFYRYDEDEVNFWVTYGRGNTPMPAWGLDGGGPMNEKQVIDVVNYLKTIQIGQQEAVSETAAGIREELARLDGADATLESNIIDQRQVVAEINQAEADAAFIGPVAEEARDILDEADTGIDTDADELSDSAETRLTELYSAAIDHFQEIEAVTLDPATPDAELVEEALAELETAVEADPVLTIQLNNINVILETAGEGEDGDGDGISDEAEGQINGQLTEASTATIPANLRTAVSLDPTNPESVSGVADRTTATRFVGALESIAITTSVSVENQEKLLETEEGGLRFLLEAEEERAWEINIPGVAEAMGVSEQEAERAVGLFNANCARCHTAGYSAGIAYTREAGSGGFGPALWDGRPVVQFGDAPAPDSDETDLLIDFLIKGSEAQKPYGLNGFGSGRMPAFGAILSTDDLGLLAEYLRSGNLDGME